MRKTVGKLVITALGITLAIIASPRTTQAYPYETSACPDGMYQCFCNTGGWLCVDSWQECDEMIRLLNCN